MTLDRWALLVHAGATLYMAGLIWFVQLVHYPLFARVGAAGFASYEAEHQRWSTFAVGPPMVIEALTALVLSFRAPAGAARWVPWLGLALLAAVWLSTALLQVPRHGELARGARLVLCGRDRARLETLARETPGDVLPLDARDLAAVGAAVEATVARHGRLDGAVNLPGSILLKPAHTTSADEWTDVIDTNLRTAFALVRAAAPALRKAGGGSIVLLSSAAARHGLANHEALAAAKAGVEGLALSAAATYAPRGVRVNVVAPGLVRTPLSAKLLSSAASVEASVAMHPIHRLGEPEDVASAIDWLLDPAQRWFTGQVLGVDGGLGSVQAR